MRIEAGLSTYEKELALMGEDYQDIFRQQVRESAERKKPDSHVRWIAQAYQQQIAESRRPEEETTPVRRNLSHIIAAAFNEPLLLEPAYARVFFCALGREMGAASLSVPQQQVQLDAPGMLAETDEYMAGGKRPARVYRVVNGIAVLPVTGTLVHRLGVCGHFPE